MEKTYFRKLIDLYDICNETGGVVEILFEDALGRTSEWLFTHPHEESGVCLENDYYIQRNYEFVKSLLNTD